MTGLSILFSMNTDEACYVYGYMDSHRRTNDQSLQHRYPGLPNSALSGSMAGAPVFDGRHLNVSDLRYVPTSDVTSYTHQPYNSDTSSRYTTTQHGAPDYHSNSRDYGPTTSLRQHEHPYTAGGSMPAKYTKSYDITNRNYDTTHNYGSPRYKSDVAPSFEFGVSYNSPKTHDITSKTGDISTHSSDRSTTFDDVITRRSPARSLSDRGAERARQEPLPDRPTAPAGSGVRAPHESRGVPDRGHAPEWGHGGERVARQRNNSGDSASSHSSDKSGATEDKTLFHALKHRYQESAEKPTTRAPFSSWRRSGNFEDVAGASTPRDRSSQETPRSASRTGSGNDRDSWQRDSNRGSVASSTDPAPSDTHTEDLVSNFRHALHRHAVSERDKSAESNTSKTTASNSAQGTEETTEQKLERLKAARAKLQEQRKSSKNVQQHTFGTEYKTRKPESKEANTDVKSEIISEIDKPVFEVNAEDSAGSKFDDSKHSQQRQSTKLARQKLVSDELRAKYMIKKEDQEKQAKDLVDVSCEEKSVTRRTSGKKLHSGDVTDRWSRHEVEEVPSMQEMLLGTDKDKPAQKTSVTKKFENVSRASPFGSVYTPKPKTESPSVSQPSEKIPEKDEEKSQKSRNEEDTVATSTAVTETPKVPKTSGKSDRRFKKYTKSKSLELGALSADNKVEIKDKVKDDSAVESSPNIDEQSNMDRLERISKYKEERRKQLETIQKKFILGDGSELPSLFLSSKEEKNEDTALNRSRSLKVDSDKRPEVNSMVMARSKSLRAPERDSGSDLSDRSSPSFREPATARMPGLKLAELGLQSHSTHSHSTDVYDAKDDKYNKDKVLDKIHALKTLKICQSGRRDYSDDARDSDSSVDILERDRPVSYGGRTLLAERGMEPPGSRGSDRGRVRSSSRESEGTDRLDSGQWSASKPAPGKYSGYGSERSRDGNISDSSDRPRRRSHSDKEESSQSRSRDRREGDKVSKFEFGTVYTVKKDQKKDGTKARTQAGIAEIDEKSETEIDLDRSDSRIRRRLPSLEDVLGTGPGTSSDRTETMKQQGARTHDFIEAKQESQTEKPMSREEKLIEDDIHRRKMRENLNTAKEKFKESERQSGVIDASKYDFGSVYTQKKGSEGAAKQKHTTMQQMLGVETHAPHVQPQSTSNAQTDVSSSHPGSVQQAGDQELKPQFDFTYEVAPSTSDVQLSSSTITEVPKPVNTPEVPTENQTGKVSARAPFSPRSERRRRMQEMFGKQDDKGAEAFSFGTSYTKKEEPKTNQSPAVQLGVDQKLEEKPKEEAKTKTKSMPIKLTSQKSVEKEEVVSPKTEPKIMSPSSQRKQTQMRIDGKSKSVGSVEGTQQSAKAPVIRGYSPNRSLTEPIKFGASKTEMMSALPNKPSEQIVSPTSNKSMKIEISSSAKLNKQSSQEEKRGFISNAESPRAPPERQTSFTKLEMKSPTAKTAGSFQVGKTTSDTISEPPKEVVKETQPTEHMPYFTAAKQESQGKKTSVKIVHSQREDQPVQAKSGSGETSKPGLETSQKLGLEVTPKLGPEVTPKPVPEVAPKPGPGVSLKPDITAERAEPKLTGTITMQEVDLDKQVDPKATIETTAMKQAAKLKETSKSLASEAILSHSRKAERIRKRSEKSEQEDKGEVKNEGKTNQPRQIAMVLPNTDSSNGSKPTVHNLPKKSVERKMEEVHSAVSQKDGRQGLDDRSVGKTGQESEKISLVAPKERKPAEHHREAGLTKFELMKQKVAAKVLVKPHALEPEDEAESGEGPHGADTTVTGADRGRTNDRRKAESMRETKTTKAPKTVKRRPKSTVELIDTNLDDILDKNVEYLSELAAAEGGKKSSTHEHQSKSKRTFKKKVSSRRSKSEDRSRFKVVSSDEEVTSRSKVTEDLPSRTATEFVTMETETLLAPAEFMRSIEAMQAGGLAGRESSPAPGTVTPAEGQGHKSTEVKDTKSIRSVSSPVEAVDSDPAGGSISQQDKSSTARTTGLVSSPDKPAARILVKSVHQSSYDSNKNASSTAQSETVQTEELNKFDATDNETFAGIATGQTSSPNVTEVFYSESALRSELCDSVPELTTTSSVDNSAMSAGSVDLLDMNRRRFVSRDDGQRMTIPSDSDQSVSSTVSALSDSSRKRRKDKSSMRKSKLNEGSSDDGSLPSRRRDSDSDTSAASRASKAGAVRRVSSSRTARESRNDKYKADDPEVIKVVETHDLANGRNKPLTHSDHVDVHHRAVQSSLLESVLPSRFALPNKVSAVISKLTEADPPATTNKKQEEAPRPIRRGNNFSQLLHKFSTSDASSSERSDTESPRGRKVLLKRQQAYVHSSGSSDDTRRTPERTQSLKLLNKESSSVGKEKDSDSESSSSVQRSSSFKSDFMKRRFSPEPDARRRLPDTPGNLEQSDKPSPELAKVLSRRNEITTKQQEDGEGRERERIHDGRVEKAEGYSCAGNDEVIADSQVLNLLRSRRQETDASVEASQSTSQHLPTLHNGENNSDKSKSSVLNSNDSSVKKTDSVLSDSASRLSSLTSTSAISFKLSSKSLDEPATSGQARISQLSQPGGSLDVSSSDTRAKHIHRTNAPTLNLTSIDTSLNVLRTVTDDLESSQDEEHRHLDETADKFVSKLSHMNVQSPTQVAEFIHSVEDDTIKKESTILSETSQVSKNKESISRSGTNVQNKAANKTVEKESKHLENKLETESSLKETKGENVPKDTRNDPKVQSEICESPSFSDKQGAININNKSEVMKKLGGRERTPELQTPRRAGPMKVMSPMNSAQSSGLTRTESVGRSDSERPKGILKRTPSLKQTGVHVDPELAEVLKSRRQKHEDVEEEDDGGKLSAQDEIRLTRVAEQGDGEEREISVAERIFQMTSKIEEVKSGPVTPRAYSGLTTPKSAVQRSGNITPRGQFSFEETNVAPSAGSGSKGAEVSGSQLIARLQNLEGWGSNLSDKRQRFQQRKREDWRTRTQPVTQEELQIADSLETVRKFRAEIIQKSSINTFEALQKPDNKQVPLKTTEFPQHYRKERQSRRERHKTLPVTAEELGAIPEGEITSTMSALRKPAPAIAPRAPKTNSGTPRVLQGTSVDEDLGEDDPVKMSVSAKASMFLQIQETLKESKEKKSASGAKRYIDRKKRERSRTLPITEDEVKLAAEMADEDADKSSGTSAGTTGPDKAGGSVDLASEEADSDKTDELTRQSLKDKVKLFASIEAEKKEAAKKKGLPPPPKRRNRKQASRFATQPVTYEEVEKAAHISPLACSLVKPPDPELLSGLSVKAARELITAHAQQTLSQPSSRAGSRTPSRATSVTDLSGTVIHTDELTASNTDVNSNYSAIDTGAGSDSVKPSSIRTRGFEPVKNEPLHSSQTTEKISGSQIPGQLDSAKKNVLKSQLEEKLSLLHKGPLGILKPGGSDGVPTISDINKALKKEASIESQTCTGSEVKGILKKEGSFETRRMEVDKTTVETFGRVLEGLPQTDSAGLEPGSSEGLESSGDNLDSDEGMLDGAEVSATMQDTPARRSSRNKRRFNRDRKIEQERYKTQPTESTDAGDTRVQKKYVGRHLTQPITPDEKKHAETATDLPPAQKSGSITDRLNALKKSGEEDWRRRVPKPRDLDKLSDRSSSSPEPQPQVKLRDKKVTDLPRPSSIADRLSSLETAQTGWKGRVEETDVKKFTIEHKITSSGQPMGESPLVTRLRGKTPRKDFNRDSISSDTSDVTSPTTPSKPLPREVTCPDLPADLTSDSKSPLASIKSVDGDEASTGTAVSVPDIGGDIETFFQPGEERKTEKVRSEELDVSVDDFNELFLNAGDMLEVSKRAKPKRRHKPVSRNPLKTMSACLEVKSEYTEVLHGVAERELKNIKVAALQQNSGFAVEALAGLASKENFSKVELRKTESNGSSSPGNTRMDPYLPLMLIHIKGRRKVQCRLVEPSAESINSGDCYVLVTSDKLIQWNGDYCNVIEKAKAADVADFIKQKRDLGCKAARDITVLEEKRGILGNARYFWELLGGHKPSMASGPVEEDELYESHVVETNMIYKLDGTKLVPLVEYWGTSPRYDMLQPDQVFVFDFGSELYVWQGKSVSGPQRKISIKLAQQLWSQGYDYSACEINPLSPLKVADEGGLPSKCPERPDWALFGKVNQNMETILFREKFQDWPDTSRLIKVKSQEDVNPGKLDLSELKPYDATLMVPVNTKPVVLVLEGSHVGRGDKWCEDMEGFVREVAVETLKVQVWHVLEYDHFLIEDHSYGQFHEGDTYVIRWQYMICNAGMKNLKGQASRFSTAGRERCAYFFWQGKTSTINEKGASALMTVELDEERGPQVRVTEGKEPACFLNLFKGRMMIHIGKREDESTNSPGPWKFYCLRNEYEREVCLIEVPHDAANLRSVSSCLLLNVETGKLIIWHGCKSPQHTQVLATNTADNLKAKCPLEVGLHKGVTINITEMKEGKEKIEFWRIFNIHMDDRSAYHCLIDNPESFTHTLRVFHMTSVSGVFEAQEVLNPSRCPDLQARFPALQTDLYMTQQPALFLIDNGHEVFLWQGWWPEGDEDQENVLTGSAQTRFTADRRCAMETTIHYCKEINVSSPPPAYMVYAGVEPLSFTNLFPFWTVDTTARDCNLKAGRVSGELVPVQDLLEKLTRTCYPLTELLEVPPPEGVDPLKLESYLSDEEFEAVLEMTREEYYALPSWKQQALKKQCGLF